MRVAGRDLGAARGGGTVPFRTVPLSSGFNSRKTGGRSSGRGLPPRWISASAGLSSRIGALSSGSRDGDRGSVAGSWRRQRNQELDLGMAQHRLYRKTDAAGNMGKKYAPPTSPVQQIPGTKVQRIEGSAPCPLVKQATGLVAPLPLTKLKPIYIRDGVFQASIRVPHESVINLPSNFRHRRNAGSVDLDGGYLPPGRRS
jgi:hypothetical protein